MVVLEVFFIMLCVVANFESRESNNACSPSPSNELPVYDKEPVFVKSVKNGKLSIVGDPAFNSSIYMLTLNGSNYEMGYAYGVLMKKELTHFLGKMFDDFFETFIKKIFKSLPEWMVILIEKVGVFPVIDLIWDLQEPFTDDFILEIFKGMADGSGVSYRKICQFNIIPSVIKSACTIFGGWGDAVVGGKLVHIRALDLPGIPVIHYPAIVTYQFDDEHSNVVTVISGVGYVGMLSAITYNPKTKDFISWSEKVWDEYNEWPQIRTFLDNIGAAWNLHCLQAQRYGKTVPEIMSILEKEKRTSRIFLGLGVSSENEGFVAKYDLKDVILTSSTNQSEYKQHPYFKGVIYIDKHPQPSLRYCLSQLIEEFYGDITPELLYRKLLPYAETGDHQVVVFDHGEEVIYVANGRVDVKDLTFVKRAWESQYVKIKMVYFK